MTQPAENPQSETAGIGHNNSDAEVSGTRLKSFIERVERLEEEKKALAEDIRYIFAEAKATGFDTKVMRKVVARRKMNAEKRREEEELLDLYLAAIGFID